MNVIVEKSLPAAAGALKTWKISSPQKKRILLLDDDRAIRQILLRLLAEEDYCVSSAANGREALAFAAATRYDLVLLDLNVPEDDGLNALHHITADNPDLPVVVITARPDHFSLALAAGVGVLLEKPLDFVRLFDTIRDLLAEAPDRPLPGLAESPLNLSDISPPLNHCERKLA